MFVVVDVDLWLDPDEMCSACACSAETLAQLVNDGILEPLGDTQAHWRFGGASLLRARRALRLMNDLGVNGPGAALALDLLDELAALRAAVRAP
ncbi:MerR family transcriptional regulator [Mitsuaria sp. WAJ17]|uniref:chaperone modulator CbpM n=1 Tax=Mitsuaria sp. WAJ17 TaxID=2761452 RepID=UPI001601FC44|nr:chaperone modulator CbpM [Mitsuaria sp. WAJ17]MBB2487482.1 MerR family transcriptional regulator [Mitsuaria sp. WAJ17]